MVEYKSGITPEEFVRMQMERKRKPQTGDPEFEQGVYAVSLLFQAFLHSGMEDLLAELGNTQERLQEERFTRKEIGRYRLRANRLVEPWEHYQYRAKQTELALTELALNEGRFRPRQKAADPEAERKKFLKEQSVRRGQARLGVRRKN